MEYEEKIKKVTEELNELREEKQKRDKRAYDLTKIEVGGDRPDPGLMTILSFLVGTLSFIPLITKPIFERFGYILWAIPIVVIAILIFVFIKSVKGFNKFQRVYNIKLKEKEE